MSVPQNAIYMGKSMRYFGRSSKIDDLLKKDMTLNLTSIYAANTYAYRRIS